MILERVISTLCPTANTAVILKNINLLSHSCAWAEMISRFGPQSQVSSAGQGPAAAVAEEHGSGELDTVETPLYLPRAFCPGVLQNAMGRPLP